MHSDVALRLAWRAILGSMLQCVNAEPGADFYARLRPLEACDGSFSHRATTCPGCRASAL